MPLPKSILLVDDDAAVREMTALFLQAGGYIVFHAASGEEALNFFQQRSEEIDLLVTDVVMPGLFGDELVVRLQRLKPDLKFILISGNPPTSLEPEIPIEEGKNFLQKPFTIHDLREAVNNQLLKPSVP